MGGTIKWPFNESQCLDADFFKLVADHLVKESGVSLFLVRYPSVRHIGGEKCRKWPKLRLAYHLGRLDATMKQDIKNVVQFFFQIDNPR